MPPSPSPSTTATKTPPLWYVCNGGAVIGPMNTATLLRGVAVGQVSVDSFVRAHVWEQWRGVLQIREVCAFRRAQEESDAGKAPSESPAPDEEGEALARGFLRCAISPGESLLLALHAAVEATRAEVALVHRFRAPQRAFVTSFTHGGELEPLVGTLLPGFDAACAAAIDGRGVWGSQGVGSAQRALVQRLGRGAALRGVAMVPVRVAGRTYAMIELGRADHPFRACDKARLAGVRRVLEETFQKEGWNPWPQVSKRPRPLLLPIA